MKHKIKGDIASWNSTIWDFNYRIKSIKEDEDIDLEINSYGGDVFIGIDLMNTLRAHPGKVTVTITGIAASAASIICMGADIIRMYSNTQLMLHNAWTIIAGNAKQLRKVADDLDSIGESVLASYTHRVDEHIVERLLEKETYLSATKAKELGFIDEIINGKPEAVDSELFQDKAREFNNSIAKIFMSDNTTKININDEQIQSIVKKVEDSVLTTLKKQNKKHINEPKQPVVAKKHRFIF